MCVTPDKRASLLVNNTGTAVLRTTAKKCNCENRSQEPLPFFSVFLRFSPFLFVFPPEVIFHSRVFGTCPVTTDLEQCMLEYSLYPCLDLGMAAFARSGDSLASRYTSSGDG